MYKIIYTSNYSSVFNILVNTEDKIKNFSHLFYKKQKLPSLTHVFVNQSPSIHVVYPYSIYSHCHKLSAQLWSNDQLPLSCLEYEFFKIEMLTYPGWGLLEEDRCVQLQDRFENLWNRWLRTDSTALADTEWEHHRSLQTHSTSFAAHSVWFKFSVGRLWRNRWRITSLSCEILFFEARVSWNILRWSLDHS